MDGSQFDSLLRSLMESRRSLLSGALALAGGTLGIANAGARKRRKKKGKKAKKPKPNAYGCLSVGAACTSEAQCCSGICDGKKGKKLCLAHDTGMCDQEAPGYCEAASPYQTRCNNQLLCLCTRTTAGSTICGTVGGPSICTNCTKDADCVAQGLPAGSACVPFTEGNCAGNCESGMACMAPCGSPLPDYLE
jgi:hypothetical protein